MMWRDLQAQTLYPLTILKFRWQFLCTIVHARTKPITDCFGHAASRMIAASIFLHACQKSFTIIIIICYSSLAVNVVQVCHDIFNLRVSPVSIASKNLCYSFGARKIEKGLGLDCIKAKGLRGLLAIAALSWSMLMLSWSMPLLSWSFIVMIFCFIFLVVKKSSISSGKGVNKTTRRKKPKNVPWIEWMTEKKHPKNRLARMTRMMIPSSSSCFLSLLFASKEQYVNQAKTGSSHVVTMDHFPDQPQQRRLSYFSFCWSCLCTYLAITTTANKQERNEDEPWSRFACWQRQKILDGVSFLLLPLLLLTSLRLTLALLLFL